MFVKTGDNVEIISGNEKGKQGTVIKAFPRENKVLVKDINVSKKHQKPTNMNPQGGIVNQEVAINVSNVKIAKKTAAKKSTAKKTTAKKSTAKKTTTTKKTTAKKSTAKKTTTKKSTTKKTTK